MNFASRKGSFRDTPVILGGIAVLVIVGFVMAYVSSEFGNNLLNETNDSNVTYAVQQANFASGVFIDIIPYAAFFLLFLSAALASVIPVNQTFAIFSIIALILYELVAIIFANFLYDFISDSSFVAFANAHVVTTGFIKYIPHIFGFFVAILIIVLFARARNSSSPLTGGAFG